MEKDPDNRTTGRDAEAAIRRIVREEIETIIAEINRRYYESLALLLKQD